MNPHLISLLTAVSLLCSTAVWADDAPLRFVDGAELTLINKAVPTPRLYARVDTVRYDGFTDYQRKNLNQHSSGLALCFKTNSNRIFVRADWQQRGAAHNSTFIAQNGFALYIKKDGKWLYAGSGDPILNNNAITLVDNMNPGEKECILYLPLFSIVDKVEIGVEQGASVEPLDNPFRHKVVVFGSSYTHGASVSHPGVTYLMQLERETGIQFAGIGVSGNSSLQQSYARVLADAEADAFLFDGFSNPSAQQIYDRFDDFIATIREKHPETPLIFMKTIYRENRNFDTEKDRFESDKMKAAEEVMRKAMDKDPNIYYIDTTSTGESHETSCDGIHPSDWGYYEWMKSIKTPLTVILKKYNIE